MFDDRGMKSKKISKQAKVSEVIKELNKILPPSSRSDSNCLFFQKTKLDPTKTIGYYDLQSMVEEKCILQIRYYGAEFAFFFFFLKGYC